MPSMGLVYLPTWMVMDGMGYKVMIFSTTWQGWPGRLTCWTSKSPILRRKMTWTKPPWGHVPAVHPQGCTHIRIWYHGDIVFGYWIFTEIWLFILVYNIFCLPIEKNTNARIQLANLESNLPTYNQPILVVFKKKEAFNSTLPWNRKRKDDIADPENFGHVSERMALPGTLHAHRE